MTPAQAEFVTYVAPALAVIAGLGALVFAALKYNREDASSVVVQQSTLLSDMRSLLDEKGEELERVKAQRDRLDKRVHELECDVKKLRKDIRREERNHGGV